MKVAYSFVVLRYIHDVLTGEFINIGVAIYSPEAKYIGGLFNPRYGRVSNTFGKINGEYYRGLMKFIENRFKDLGNKLENQLPIFDKPKNIVQIINSVLPLDDSSLQWSEAGCGSTDNPTRALENLYQRMVCRYEDKGPVLSRDDSDVWRVFKREFEARRILHRLQPKLINARDYGYEFKHAWQNEHWHVYEPVSFDLQETESILDKANRWLGRITILRDTQEEFKIHMLLGEPSLEKHRQTFIKAENILNKIPGKKEFIREHEAQKFSEELANTILSHDSNN
jgi:hypothetical protein